MQEKKAFSIPWPVRKAVYVTVGVILILLLIGYLLELAFVGLLGILFPQEVREVPLSYVNQEIGVDVSSGMVLENWDDHGGFLGDGETLVRIQFAGEDGAAVEEALSVIPGYIRGPFTPSAEAILTHWSEESFPNTEQILWKLKDRNPDSQASVNITLVIYDPQSKILYYYEKDT